jgi:glycosyltransferase involved in cell wall biosynthesis
MDDARVTVLIPNYRTLDLTKLCLRSLRKYTDSKEIHVIVIDNDSQDASLDYLRSLKWIELIERKRAPDDTPSLSHSRALDLALERVKTPYVLSIHSDTFVRHPKWLDFLVGKIEAAESIAGVGSWKLENKPFLRRLAKSIEFKWQSSWYRLIGKTEHALEGKGENYYYLRSHCALYRMGLIKALNLHFSDGGETAGKVMHKRLLDAGYRMVFLSSELLGRYVVHLNHATMVLHPELGARGKTIARGLRRVQKGLKELGAADILADDALDHPEGRALVSVRE